MSAEQLMNRVISSNSGIPLNKILDGNLSQEDWRVYNRTISQIIESDLIISSSESYISFREEQNYYVDFLLNFGNDQQCIANNIKLDTESEVEPSILIKLYEPLPVQFGLK